MDHVLVLYGELFAQSKVRKASLLYFILERIAVLTSFLSIRGTLPRTSGQNVSPTCGQSVQTCGGCVSLVCRLVHMCVHAPACMTGGHREWTTPTSGLTVVWETDASVPALQSVLVNSHLCDCSFPRPPASLPDPGFTPIIFEGRSSEGKDTDKWGEAAKSLIHIQKHFSTCLALH